MYSKELGRYIRFILKCIERLGVHVASDFWYSALNDILVLLALKILIQAILYPLVTCHAWIDNLRAMFSRYLTNKCNKKGPHTRFMSFSKRGYYKTVEFGRFLCFSLFYRVANCYFVVFSRPFKTWHRKGLIDSPEKGFQSIYGPNWYYHVGLKYSSRRFFFIYHPILIMSIENVFNC